MVNNNIVTFAHEKTDTCVLMRDRRRSRLSAHSAVISRFVSVLMIQKSHLPKKIILPELIFITFWNNYDLRGNISILRFFASVITSQVKNDAVYNLRNALQNIVFFIDTLRLN